MAIKTEAIDLAVFDDEFDYEEETEYYFYYEKYPTKEDLMTEASFHDRLIDYIKAILDLMFPKDKNFVASDLGLYLSRNRMEYPVGPDVSLIKNVPWQAVRSWHMKNAPDGQSNPPPDVVFEVGSDETWGKDRRNKPNRYARIGIKEYFAYDPRPKAGRWANQPRLYGWRLVGEGNQAHYEVIPDNEQGWKWSEQLQSWLQPDGSYVRFHTADGELRLTAEETERAEKERLAAINERLMRKLRELNIDPDSL